MINIKVLILSIWIYSIILCGFAEDNILKSSTDYLLCRHCGYNIAPATALVNIKSPAAEEIHNQSLFGLENVEVQSLRNPVGIKFNIITATGGTCVAISKRWQLEYSWYPGYAWKACTCSKCSRHIGWVFEPLATAADERVYASINGLYAFILENVISEAYFETSLPWPRTGRCAIYANNYRLWEEKMPLPRTQIIF